jgi:hypothetical protein
MDIDWSVMTPEDMEHMYNMYEGVLERERENAKSLRYTLACVILANGGNVFIPERVIMDVLDKQRTLAIKEWDALDTLGKYVSVVEEVE